VTASNGRQESRRSSRRESRNGFHGRTPVGPRRERLASWTIAARLRHQAVPPLAPLKLAGQPEPAR